jgi:hypothetical protein
MPHSIPGLFAALSVLSIDIRRKDPIRRQLAENRSRQCMLALKVLSKRWPVGGWILRLFISLLSRLTGGNFGFEQHRQPTLQTDSSNYHPHSPNTLMDPLTNGQNMNQMGIGQPFPLGEQGGLNEHLDLHLDVPDFWDQGIFSLDYLFHDTFLPPAQTGHLADLGDIDEGQ